MTAFPNDASIHAEVLRVLRLVLGVDAFGGQFVRQTCPDWDSLKHVQIVFALEDAFGVAFSLEELADLNDSETIARYVAERLGA
jgi:acyl carrier protein